MKKSLLVIIGIVLISCSTEKTTTANCNCNVREQIYYPDNQGGDIYQDITTREDSDCSLDGTTSTEYDGVNHKHITTITNCISN